MTPDDEARKIARGAWDATWVMTVWLMLGSIFVASLARGTDDRLDALEAHHAEAQSDG